VPIYDYVCNACGHRFEMVHGVNETGPQRCRECGGPVSRVFAPPTLVFKGSGWARTDRRASSVPRKEARPKADEAPAGPAEPAAATEGGASGAAAPEPTAAQPAPAGDAKASEP